MASSARWCSLQSFVTSHLSDQLVKINDLEFAKYSPKSKCIQKYNIMDNEWNDWINLESLKVNVDYGAVYGAIALAFDINKHKLYIQADKQLTVFNVKQNTHKTFDCQYVISHSNPIIVAGKLHIIGGVHNFGMGNKHLSWNDQQIRFDIQYEFDCPYGQIAYPGLIYLKSKKQLLLMGGFTDRYTNTIYAFNMQSSKWTRLKQTLPYKAVGFGCIATRNDEYVLLFGGKITDSFGSVMNSDNVYILNTKTMEFNEVSSGIKCPEQGYFLEAINMNSLRNEELLCSGYIRYLWNMPLFNHLINLPFYLIKIIQQYFAIENIHLIDSIAGKHWKINVDEIIMTSPINV